MIEKNNLSRILFNVLNYGFMAVFAVLCIAPIWHVVMASISNPRMLMNASGILWTPMGNPTFAGYELISKNKDILSGYGNTLLYVIWHCTVGTLCTTIAGFLVILLPN